MIFLYSFNLVPSVRVGCMTIIHQSNALETDWQKVEWSKSHWLSRGLYVWVCRWLVDCFVKGCVCVCYLCVLVLTHVPRRSGRASRLSAVSKLTSLPPTPRETDSIHRQTEHMSQCDNCSEPSYLAFKWTLSLSYICAFYFWSTLHRISCLPSNITNESVFMAAGKVILPQFEMASSCGKCLVVILTTGGWLYVSHRHCCLLLKV